jgi:alkylated DNA repair dioxygenase AlkB
LIPEAVKPSYCYLGLYVAGAALAKHTDREQCEYTLSLTIDATPHSDAANAWPLYADLANGETIEALLGAGDGLIFKGRELPHYRHELPEGRTSSSIFFHYVPVGFTGSLN